jgi:phosphatidate cytidylyltransferase
MSGWWSNPLHLGLAGLLCTLGLATLFVAWLVFRHPDRSYTELRLRVRTWWVIIAVFIAAIVSSRGIGIAIFGLVSFLAFKEFLTLVPTRRADYRVLMWA